MQKQLLAVSMLIVGLVAGTGVGYFLTPQYAQTMYSKNMDLGQADSLVDLRYINAMIAHHRGAMLLAEQAQAQSQRTEIKELAANILKNEPELIAELYTWKKDWYSDGRQVQDPNVAQLGTYDASFDLRFLNALIAHHESGIAMTQDIRLKSSRTEILNNADAVEDFLITTLAVFDGWRTDWYLSE